MLERKPCDVVHNVPLEKPAAGYIQNPSIFELKDGHSIDQERKHAWLQREITTILTQDTTPFTTYIEKNTPSRSNFQKEKKLIEYQHAIAVLNKILPGLTDITHDPSRIRIIDDRQEVFLHAITQETAHNEKPIRTITPYMIFDFPNPYYGNSEFFSPEQTQKINTLIFYQETDIKQHLSYVNFDPIQPSISSLYKDAIKKRINPSTDIQFQDTYIKSLLGYINSVKKMYKTIIMGELAQQIKSDNEHICLLLEEYADKITHHSLITYIQQSGIVFPLQTIVLYNKKSAITISNYESVKDILMYWAIGGDKKKQYDGIAQSTADDEMNFHSLPRKNKHQKTNEILRYLSTHGYDFFPAQKRGFAKITDEQTNKTIDCEIDIVEYQGNQIVWKKVWEDMQNGILDELLKN